MTRTKLFTAAFVLLLVPVAAHAQNREHLQMNADIRILQEHVSRLQLAVNRVEEQLAATNKRIDEVSSSSVKGFADQQLLINQLSGAITAVRERLDDNSVRVSQLTQEFTAVREGVRMLTAQINNLVSLLQPNAGSPDPSTDAAPAPPDTTAGSPVPPAAGGNALGPVVLPMSANRIYSQAMNDYLSARYDIAIDGFREVVEKYPDAPDAANAQLQIGDALYQKGGCREAIVEYQKFLDTYKNSDRKPDGLFMLGVCYADINQRANAQRTFQQVIKEYPDSIPAIQAKQRLTAMGVNP